MKYKMEVCVDGTWSSNACVYGTQLEAEKAGKELLQRWYVPTDSRGVEYTGDQEVNYQFVNGQNQPIN